MPAAEKPIRRANKGSSVLERFVSLGEDSQETKMRKEDWRGNKGGYGGKVALRRSTQSAS